MVLTVMSVPVTTNALTIVDMQAQIQTLLFMIVQLQQQLTSLSSAQPIPDEQPIPVQQPIPISNLGMPQRMDCLKISSTLYRGMSDSITDGDVSELQKFLKRLGYFTYKDITGYYGDVTMSAVKQYQESKDYKSVADGNIDEVDIEYMSKSCGII
jgi:hypothetical protein